MLLTALLLLSVLVVCGASEQQRSKGLRLFWGDGDKAPPYSWAEQSEGEEAYLMMSSWLNAFHASTSSEYLSSPPPRRPTLNSPKIPARTYFHEPESSRDRHVWRRWNESMSCDEMASSLLQTLKPVNRKFFIIAPVGSSFNASQWMTHPDIATYDIIALYYGNKNFSCPLCKAVFSKAGPKWGLLNEFLHSALWKQLEQKQQYDAVMVADDDLDFGDTCTLNRVFEVFSSYGLLMGQPSLCKKEGHQSTYWEHLYLRPHSVLRYVSFVEIMAPIFALKNGFFQTFIAPSLWNAYAGWGLDFTWPFLLRYPQRHIAVIDDAVCMTHANSPGGADGESNVYAVPVPYDQREEENRRVAEYGYYPSRVEAMGFLYRNMETFGEISKTVYSKADLAAVVVPANGEEKASISDETKAFLALAGVAGLGLLVVSVVGQHQRRRGRGRRGA